jgi:iron complex outermembrane recepter protein
VFSGFAQHQIQLGSTVRVTTGAKVEHNDFSGAEVQPSVRATWDAAPGHNLWGSVSRAVRIPTRLERDIAIDASPPTGNPVARLLGNEAFDAERMVAFEVGYRWLSSAALLLDVAAYHNRYSGLASLEQGAPFASGGRTMIPIINQNLTKGHGQGLEAMITVVPATWWRLVATSTTTWLDLTARGADLNRGRFFEGATPRHQFGLRSMLDIGAAVTLDAYLRYLTAIRQLPPITAGTGFPGYAELDLRAAWQATSALELSLVGQNLLAARHIEFGAPESRGEMQRAVYASLAWRR